MGAFISFLVIAIVVLLILSSCIRIVPQAQALVVERLGAYLEAFAKAADGKATKIIIPSEIQGIAGLVKGLTEVGTDVQKAE